MIHIENNGSSQVTRYFGESVKFRSPRFVGTGSRNSKLRQPLMWSLCAAGVDFVETELCSPPQGSGKRKDQKVDYGLRIDSQSNS